MKKIISPILCMAAVATSGANAEVYRSPQDRVYIGASIPNHSDPFKRTWFYDNKKLEFKAAYRLPRQAEDALYDGSGYITFKIKGDCYIFNIKNTFTYAIPCAAHGAE